MQLGKITKAEMVSFNKIGDGQKPDRRQRRGLVVAKLETDAADLVRKFVTKGDAGFIGGKFDLFVEAVNQPKGFSNRDAFAGEHFSDWIDAASAG